MILILSGMKYGYDDMKDQVKTDNGQKNVNKRKQTASGSIRAGGVR